MGRAVAITTPSVRTVRVATFLTAALVALLLGACANSAKIGEPFATADAKIVDNANAAPTPQSELERALDYWGKQLVANPRDLKAAINYAKNLKAAGERERALAVLQEASTHHGNDREMASEYGRLALEMGQTGLAQQLLAVADNPAKPDWRVISARGTVLAKQGQYAQAIPLYERALALAPDQPSVVSNLAMAHAANGEAQRAETLLRKVADLPGSDVKVRQNLALVLGIQGKYDEARVIASKDVAPEAANANVDYVRQMVRAAPQTGIRATPAVGGSAGQGLDAGKAWSTTITTASIKKPTALPANVTDGNKLPQP